MNDTEMRTQMESGDGFIAALDQSGGSTPKALKGYGIEEGAWSTDEEMFEPHPPDALADHHLARLQRRQGDRRDPVRADDGRRDRRQAGARGAEGARRRAVHQDRQGPRGRGGRRPADEADARARRPAEPRQAARRVRHQGALGDQPRQSRRASPPSSRSSSRSRGRCSPPASSRSSSPRSTSRAPSAPRPTGSCSRNCSSALDALPGDDKVMLKLSHPGPARPVRAAGRSIRACCAWWRFRAASPAPRPAASSPGIPGMIASFSPRPARGSAPPDERRGVRPRAGRGDRRDLRGLDRQKLPDGHERPPALPGRPVRPSARLGRPSAHRAVARPDRRAG